MSILHAWPAVSVFLAAFLVLPVKSRRHLFWISRTVMGFLAILSFTRFLGLWPMPDALDSWFFTLVAILSFIGLWYSEPYIAREWRSHRWSLRTVKRYYALLFIFVSSLLAVPLLTNFMALWLSMEVATLSSVILVATVADSRSTEASWKYLYVTEAGGMAALVGTVLAVVMTGHSLNAGTLHPAIAHPDRIYPEWALVGTAMVLIGYGTKAGLAPFHTWLPDAHSEAPAPISALLSGLKLSAAVLLIYRTFQLVSGTVPESFLKDSLIGLGLLSLFVSAAFVAFQSDLKRLWAYSSIEHIGLISLGMGFGGIALVGAVLHIWTHAAGKTLLFHNAGTIRALYHTSDMSLGARGIISRTPWSGGLLALGAASIVGLPPFAPFWSEWLIFAGGFHVAAYRLPVVLAIFFLVVIFIGVAWRMPFWLFTPGMRHGIQERIREPWALIAPSIVLAVMVTFGGIGIPLAAGPLWHHLLGQLLASSL